MDQTLREELHVLTTAVLRDAAEVSHEIFTHPEAGEKEYHAVEYLTEKLKEQGFRVEIGVGKTPTAFSAEYGNGHPRIALLAEYDALPGYGENRDQWGHACGHNWIAANCYGTALVMKKLIDEGKVHGTICYMGCPAEETVGGKITMVENGVFDDMDAAMQIHISNGKKTWIGSQALALNGIEFTFHGVSSHAAAAPQNGINALDACYLMFDGVNALRQHVTPDVRMHGVIINGGLAPNVVPALTVSRWEVRASTRKQVDELEQKVFNIAKGACLMTGATYEWKYFENKFDNCMLSEDLLKVFDEAVPESGVEDYARNEAKGSGSTDVGNVSQVCPTVYAGMGVGNTDACGCHEEAFLQYLDCDLSTEALAKAIYTQAYTCAEICVNKELQEKIGAYKKTLMENR